MKQAKIYIWLKDDTQPTEAGVFSWYETTKTGNFEYDALYLTHPKRIALDPVNLPLKRGRFKEVSNKGIFGVIRDSGPDSWGRDLLTRQFGELDEFDCMARAGSDGVGAITMGLPDVQPSYITLDELDGATRVVESISTNKEVDGNIQLAIEHVTSLGGAKPKFTLIHNNELWIAKFTEKGDRPFLPHNEHAMLTLAKEVGIDSCDSFVHKLPDGRSILLVRRFDRVRQANGHSRIPYASAHTILDLTGEAGSDYAKKSYPRIIDVSKRWAVKDLSDMRQALWERIVFNGLISNIDDHARNHGLLYDYTTDRWKLSPAFDIVAFPSSGNVTLSLSISKKGATVTLENLLSSAADLGLSKELAEKRLLEMAMIVNNRWENLMLETGVDAAYIDYIKPAFRMAKHIADTLSPTKQPHP